MVFLNKPESKTCSSGLMIYGFFMLFASIWGANFKQRGTLKEIPFKTVTVPVYGGLVVFFCVVPCSPNVFVRESCSIGPLVFVGY